MTDISTQPGGAVCVGIPPTTNGATVHNRLYVTPRVIDDASGSAVLDSAHVGDIVGAFRRIRRDDTVYERFGKFCGAFSIGDLLILNVLTIVTEFIGVSLALGFLGCPKMIAIPVAAVLLFGVVAGGSFRRWEQLMFVLIAANVALIPVVLMVHPTVGESVRGLVPSLRGGPDSIVLMVIMAIVGTTVAPWQLFFQQSNVVDKRITPRWIPYGRADLVIGIVAVMAGAVISQLSEHVGHTVGVLFAIVLLDASLIGANTVGLATTYTLGDVLGKPHSLQRRTPCHSVRWISTRWRSLTSCRS